MGVDSSNFDARHKRWDLRARGPRSRVVNAAGCRQKAATGELKGDFHGEIGLARHVYLLRA